MDVGRFVPLLSDRATCAYFVMMRRRGWQRHHHLLTRNVVGWAVTFAAMLMNGAAAGPAPAPPTPGELAVTAVSAGSDGVIVVRIANTGAGPVEDIALAVEPPPGVSPVVEPAAIPVLDAGVSMLATVRLDGLPAARPAALVVTVTGRTTSGPSAAVTSIDLDPTESAVTLELVGNTRLTEASPAEMLAVVHNSAGAPVDVALRGTAGPHQVRLAAQGDDASSAEPGEPISLTIPAGQSAVVQAQVEAGDTLRRGAVALVLTATVDAQTGALDGEVTASRQLDVALAVDALPPVLGLGSLLVLPGLLAVWAFLAVRDRDRRRIGLVVVSAGKRIWEEKLPLVWAGLISVSVAVAYVTVGRPSLLDTYRLIDIAIVTVATMLLGVALAAVVVGWHRYRVPAVEPTSPPLDALRAAAKADDDIERNVFRTADSKEGLLVHDDYGAKVLVPPVEYTDVDGVDRASSMEEALRLLDATGRPETHVRFSTGTDLVGGPVAVPDAVSTPRLRRALVYRDSFD